MRYALTTLSLIASSLAATIPSEPWTTLTPTATMEDATTDYTTTFGIQIVTISEVSASATSTAVAKRDVVNQIGDGQIQNQSASSTASPSTTSTTAKTTTTAAVVNQIGDGQIQNQSATTSSTTSTTTTAAVVNQIGDGQIQNQSASTTTASTADGVNQISDGQVQATATAAASDDGIPEACLTSDSLAMVLESSVLTDAKGRIGAIVANRQFQFDGPPPQSGSIYAAGWSITDDGNLALGDSDIFYQCKSGDFYNLYDENVATQCEAVYLSIIDLVDC